jgi:hypothetical protein
LGRQHGSCFALGLMVSAVIGYAIAILHNWLQRMLVRWKRS